LRTEKSNKQTLAGAITHLQWTQLKSKGTLRRS